MSSYTTPRNEPTYNQLENIFLFYATANLKIEKIISNNAKINSPNSLQQPLAFSQVVKKGKETDLRNDSHRAGRRQSERQKTMINNSTNTFSHPTLPQLSHSQPPPADDCQVDE